MTEMYKKKFTQCSVVILPSGTINHVVAITKIHYEKKKKKIVVWVNLTHHGSQRINCVSIVLLKLVRNFFTASYSNW